jgi:hypothetical protein
MQAISEPFCVQMFLTKHPFSEERFYGIVEDKAKGASRDGRALYLSIEKSVISGWPTFYEHENVAFLVRLSGHVDGRASSLTMVLLLVLGRWVMIAAMTNSDWF